MNSSELSILNATVCLFYFFFASLMMTLYVGNMSCLELTICCFELSILVVFG